MDLQEKLAKRATGKAKQDRVTYYGSLFVSWCILIPLVFHLISKIDLTLKMGLSYHDQVIALFANTWWIVLPLIAAYYQIKNCHRKLGW